MDGLTVGVTVYLQRERRGVRLSYKAHALTVPLPNTQIGPPPTWLINQKRASLLLDVVGSDADLAEQIAVAFGHDGLGIIAVKNVPDFVERRSEILPIAYKFANLPAEIKNKYEVPPYFQRGWDCGHESMKDGVADLSKGSFYVNPQQDSFPEVDSATIAKYPTFFGDNVFPTEEIPEFESTIKDACKLMISVGASLAAHCDTYVKSKIPDFPANRMADIVTESKHHAARLLHYFPIDAKKVEAKVGEAVVDEDDNWCGWHNDHCTLTALMPAMFHDVRGSPILCPDENAGLYIKARNGDVVHAKTPKNVLLFQIGETAQIHTGGLLKATPHMVRGAVATDVSRSTLAVFMEPGLGFDVELPSGEGITVEKTVSCPHMPPAVPTLASRWNNSDGDTFGEFTRRTIEAYYSQKTPETVV
eukprot:CFRG5175T1